jgi:hypothetical protein
MVPELIGEKPDSSKNRKGGKTGSGKWNGADWGKRPNFKNGHTLKKGHCRFSLAMLII